VAESVVPGTRSTSSTQPAPPPASSPRAAGSIRVGAIGVSLSEICGVRDHAQLLADALEGERVDSSLHWLWRRDAPLRATRAQMGEWTSRLASELAVTRPDAVLLHYSVFSFAYRGFPVFVHPLLSVLRRSGVPLVSLLHEYAYPWHLGGRRGKAWALSQRALLLDVVRASAALAPTTDARADWLASRSWLPHRRTVVSPVFSNLPPARASFDGDRQSSSAAVDRERPRVGLFGYAHEGIEKGVVIDAMRLLEDRGVGAELVLLGAPGADSAAAEAWRRAAQEGGIAHAPSFTGLLAAQDLADTLARCELLLSADRIGPTSRRTTLAASLTSGRAVVAIDGRQSWSRLRESGAVRLVEASPEALAGAIAELLGSPDARASLGERGRVFAERFMSPTQSAGILAGLLDEVLS
jgi:glycosyltransferase involved in cell wall biosynthesis